MSVDPAQWLEWQVNALRIVVEEEPDPHPDEIRHYLSYMDGLARTPLRDTPQGKEYQRLIVTGARKFVGLYPDWGRGPLLNVPTTRWWWHLDKLAKGILQPAI